MERKNITADSVVTLSEAAEELGVDPRVVRRGILDGQLPAHRLGKRTWRLIWSDVHVWVRKHRVRPDRFGSADSARQRADEILQNMNLGGKR